MGMRHIKNTSPHRIPVVISVLKPDNNTLTIELKHGQSILVNDTGAATKSVIIQVKKSNITMSDEFPEGMTPYEVCTIQENSEPINETYVESENYVPVIDENITDQNSEPVSAPIDVEIVQQVAAQLENVAPGKKAGRPKGSTKKKRGRPKGSTKKKKLKKLKVLENGEQKNIEQTGEQSQ